jgi:hypothetical protein
VMGVARAGPEPRAHAGMQRGLALVSDENRVAFEDVTNSSSLLWVWRNADMPPAGSRVRFTPKWVRPNASPSARRTRPATRDANGSG